MEKRTSPAEVGCPFCGAFAWERCFTKTQKRVSGFHDARRVEAIRQDHRPKRADA